MVISQLQCWVSWRRAICTFFLSMIDLRCSLFLLIPLTFAWKILKSRSFRCFGCVWGGAFFLGLKRFFLIFFFFQYVCNRSAWEATDPGRYLLNRVAVPTRIKFLAVFGFIGIILGAPWLFCQSGTGYWSAPSKQVELDYRWEFSLVICLLATYKTCSFRALSVSGLKG